MDFVAVFTKFAADMRINNKIDFILTKYGEINWKILEIIKFIKRCLFNNFNISVFWIPSFERFFKKIKNYPFRLYDKGN